MDKAYNAKKVEDKIYQTWEKSGFFNPNNLPERKIIRPPKSAAGGRRRTSNIKNVFCIVLPPPNATGVLHIGHAMMLAIEDLMIRYKRMQGLKTLWLPGTDHAAIATQNKVEKLLWEKEKKTRHDLGREKFLKRVEEYALESRQVIKKQLKKMGSSLDWSREKYTLDEDLSLAVRTQFKNMSDDGLIYRGQRIVNWCPRCHSTLADDEVEYQPTKEKLYWLKYGPFKLATARPETKLGDTCVAVHPSDQRYKKYVGKKITIPGVIGDFEVSVVADRAVDPQFGTGVVKVTPAHDFTDYEIAQRHGIPLKQVIDEDGKMMANCGKYAGLTTAECREAIVGDMKKKGWVIKIDENYEHNLSICYRCGSVVEPIPSEQWFVNVNSQFPIPKSQIKGIKSGEKVTLKQLMKQVVKNGQIEILPQRFEKTYFHWIDNLRDWCISRQIWFGHRIPVWYKNQENIKTLKHENKRMGFAGTVVPQLFVNKTKTYRLRDHGFKKGDIVDFENSATGEIFGQGTITHVLKTTVGRIPLDDKAHSATYKKRSELIKAFKKHHPEMEISNQTPAWIYTYQFTPAKNIVQLTYFVHGTSRDNEKGVASGQAQVSLSKLGQQQAKELKERLKNEKFDAVFCSDLKRAIQTAEIVFGKNIIKDKRLREIDYGQLTQKKTSQVYPLKLKVISQPFLGGESYQDVEVRILDFLSDLLDKYAGKKIAIVAHQAPQLALEVILKNKTWAQAFKEDWRNKKKWQPGWDYHLEKLTYVGVEAPKGKDWVQDEDTLDTWFSSGLWTFSTLGWPKQTKDLKTFHPTSVMETGYDILFFWVARMILMSTYALGEIPFETVYLHGLVRDEQGRKMSKSLGNAIDPLEVIDKYGTDALRLSYLIGIAPGQDLKLYDEKFIGARNFVNKLWNISRYILDNVKIQNPNVKSMSKSKIQMSKLTLADRWILSELNRTIEGVTNDLERWDFSSAGEKLRQFSWGDFADWYLEISKIEKDKEQILFYVLENLLKLWHPFMPFVTEEIWSKLKKKDLLMIQEWPQFYKKLIDNKAEKDFIIIQNLITTIRNLRAENKVEVAKKVKVVIRAREHKKIKTQEPLIKFLARVEKLELIKSGKVKKAASAVIKGMEVYLLLEGLVDFTKERSRIEKEISEIKKYKNSLEKKLDNKNFITKAPKEVVAGERNKLKEAEEKLKKLNKQLKNLS